LIVQPRGVVCSVGAAFTQGTQTDDTACSTGYCTTEPWSSCVLRRDVGNSGSGAVQRLCSDRGLCSDRHRGTMCLMRGRAWDKAMENDECRIGRRGGGLSQGGIINNRMAGWKGGGRCDGGLRRDSRAGETRRQDKARPDKTRSPSIE
jgi:hypothetical protein